MFYWDDILPEYDVAKILTESKPHPEEPMLSEKELYLQQQKYCYEKYEAQHKRRAESFVGRKHESNSLDDDVYTLMLMMVFLVAMYGCVCWVLYLNVDLSGISGTRYEDDPVTLGEQSYSNIRGEKIDNNFGYRPHQQRNKPYRNSKYGRAAQNFHGESLFNGVDPIFMLWTILTTCIRKLVDTYFTVWTIMGSVFWLTFVSALYEYFERMYRCVEKRIQQGPLYVRPRYSTTNLIRKPEDPLLKIRVERTGSAEPTPISVIERLEEIVRLDSERRRIECPTTRKMICSKIERLEHLSHLMLNDEKRFDKGQIMSKGLFNEEKRSTVLPFVDSYPGKKTYKTLLPKKKNIITTVSTIVPHALIGRKVQSETPAIRLILQLPSPFIDVMPFVFEDLVKLHFKELREILCNNGIRASFKEDKLMLDGTKNISITDNLTKTIVYKLCRYLSSLSNVNNSLKCIEPK